MTIGIRFLALLDGCTPEEAEKHYGTITARETIRAAAASLVAFIIFVALAVCAFVM